MMAQGNNQPGDRRRDRRTGAERRADNGKTRVSQAAVRLLSKLFATLLGTLLGFLMAYVISVIFVSDFQKRINEATSRLTGIEADLSEMNPGLVSAEDEYRRLRNKYEEWAEEWLKQNVVWLQRNQLWADDFEASLKQWLSDNPRADRAPRPIPPIQPVDGVEPPAEEDRQPAVIATVTPPGEFPEFLTTYFAAEGVYTPLKRQKDSLERDRDFWEAQRKEHQVHINQFNTLSIAVVLIFTMLGYITYPLQERWLSHTMRQWSDLFRGPESRMTQALVGFFAGLILAVILLLAIFSTLNTAHSIFDSSLFRLLSGLVVVVILGSAGSLIGITFFGPPQQDMDPYDDYRVTASVKILDTSVIIDGRVSDVAQTGFLGGALVVTNSVLRELQSLADSADERKRSKGRRGLELVKQVQEDPRVDLRVFDDSSFDGQAHSTDEQLILVAHAMQGQVVTNDYNLNRVAAIRNVRVLNINALAGAVKTNHLPGDFIEIQILERGSQRGQGKGYLDDGTMVVIEDGEPFINQSILIKLTSVTQTAQGRMLFGRVDAADGHGNGN